MEFCQIFENTHSHTEASLQPAWLKSTDYSQRWPCYLSDLLFPAGVHDMSIPIFFKICLFLPRFILPLSWNVNSYIYYMCRSCLRCFIEMQKAWNLSICFCYIKLKNECLPYKAKGEVQLSCYLIGNMILLFLRMLYYTPEVIIK